MPRRDLLAVLVLCALGSSVLVWKLDEAREPDLVEHNVPDYSMEGLSTLGMDRQGRRKERLQATHMAHYSQHGITRVLQPRLTMFRMHGPALEIVADAGVLSKDGQQEQIQLRGNVRLRHYDRQGALHLKISTDSARVLRGQDYVDTETLATLRGERFVIESVGMKVYLQEERVEFVRHVRTVINSAAVEGDARPL